MLSFFRPKPKHVVTADEALPGRDTPVRTTTHHEVNGRPLWEAPPQGFEELVVGMGCFWGVERLFWQTEGVWVTAAGYAGGHTPNPTYEETCTGRTGHTEVVRVVYDPSILSTEQLLAVFWEGHDPTQGMRQGNDVGTVYRSALYTTTDAQAALAQSTRDAYQQRLTAAGYGPITTEIKPLDHLWPAEDYHQQYLAPTKNPNGYCGLAGTGVSCPVGLGVEG